MKRARDIRTAIRIVTTITALTVIIYMKYIYIYIYACTYIYIRRMINIYIYISVKDRVNLKLTEKLGHSALFLGSLRCVSLFEPVVDKTFRGSGVHSTCTWCTASCTA